MDGFELAARIKRDGRAAAIVMLTSGARPDDLARCRELDLETYMMKPVRQGELLAMLQRVLAAAPALV